ncbi:MAG TPA: PKD domain-containing protein, partial [Flavobacteriales bacterium]|nr:PKD domain-containing protein [Flavobacteriales bacterium]
KTYTLDDGETQTINNYLDAVGTASFPISIQSESPGSKATIYKDSGLVCGDYLNLVDLNAVGGATFRAGGNSVDLGNNDGWVFTCCEQCEEACSYDNIVDFTFAAPFLVGDSVNIPCLEAGKLVRITSLLAGLTYRISTCGSSFDTQLSIYPAGGGSSIAFNDDACGEQAEIYFTPFATGAYDILVDKYICINDLTCANFTIELTGTGGCYTSFDYIEDSTKTLFYTAMSSPGVDSWTWDFGDGTTSTLANPVHTYSYPTDYYVCLTVSDPGGCNTTWCEWVSVGNDSVSCNADYTVWVDTSKTAYFNEMASNETINYAWAFGDGDSSLLPNPVHQYIATGSYWTCLTITTADSCTNTWCDIVEVGAGNFCNADFSYFRDTARTIYYTDNSTGGITDWYWDFGDGNTSTAQNPPHSYGVAGNYWVCLTAFSDTICTNTWCELVEVTNTTCFNPILSFTAPSCKAGCDGVASISVSDGLPPYTYAWDDLLNSTNSSASGLCAGEYTVTLIDSFGCRQTDTIVVTEPSQLGMSVTGTVSSNCNTADGSITVAGSGGVGPYSYVWNDITQQTNATVTGLAAGFYTVTVTDNNGCMYAEAATISDNGGPVITINSANDVTICKGNENGSIDINVTGAVSPYTYDWSEGSTTQDISGLGVGPYSVVVTGALGCISSMSVTLNEPIGMSLSVSSTDANCGGNNGSAAVFPSGGSMPYTYTWSSGGSNPIENGLIPGVYSVTIIDANSCFDSTFVTISNIGESIRICTYHGCDLQWKCGWYNRYYSHRWKW